MKRLTILLFTIICVPIVAYGAQVYGNLRFNNASVGPNVPVNIQCADGSKYDGRTDGYGSYSVPLRAGKKCALSVYFNGKWSDPFNFYPYDDAVRYDFDLVDPGNGTIGLRRR